MDLAFLHFGDTSLHLISNAMVIENRGEEFLTTHDVSIAFDLHAIHAKITDGGFIGKPENIGFITQSFFDQILVNIDNVFKGGTLTGCPGMPRTHHQFDLFSLLHAVTQSEVGITSFNGMRQGTDGMCKTIFWPKAGCARKIKQRPGGDDKIIVIKAHFLPRSNSFAQYILVACIGVNFFCSGMHELYVHFVVHRF